LTAGARGSTLAGPVRILGHRGASADAPENTLPAFQLALSQGAEGVELDTRLCGSGEAVVFHDEQLDRLTGRPGRAGETPWSVLRTLEVRGPGGAGTARIPLLAEVLEALPRTTLINVELKSEDWHHTAIAEVAGQLLEEGRHAEHVMVSSFQPLCLVRLALRFPRLARGLLLDPERGRLFQEGVALPLVGRDAVHPHYSRVSEADVRRWHGSGRRVAVWTVDAPEVARRLQGWGVDILITNRPGALRAALSSGVN
jgi:glycerophosphoryl diester phosphodiesterase